MRLSIKMLSRDNRSGVSCMSHVTMGKYGASRNIRAAGDMLIQADLVAVHREKSAG